jgi:hypothetical protein
MRRSAAVFPLLSTASLVILIAIRRRGKKISWRKPAYSRPHALPKGGGAPAQGRPLYEQEKTASLLNAGTSMVIAGETPSPDIVRRYGTAPNVYSGDINYWLWDLVIDHFRNHRNLLYRIP